MNLAIYIAHVYMSILNNVLICCVCASARAHTCECVCVCVGYLLSIYD